MSEDASELFVPVEDVAPLGDEVAVERVAVPPDELLCASAGKYFC